MRITDEGEIQYRRPTVTRGYWNDPAATATAFTSDGWYRTGDIGHLDPAGRLILSGRIKDIIVLPNGFNVYPEDIENALRIAGIRNSVVLETRPGRIEAIVLGSAAGAPGIVGGDDPAGLRVRIDAAVKAANGTLGPNQRIAGWRLWPDEDFPRTHTLKVKRTQVRAWLAVEIAAANGLSAGASPGRELAIRSRPGTRSRASRARPRSRAPRDPGRRPAATDTGRRSIRPAG